MEQKGNSLLRASQMVGIGLSQLLMLSYQRIDELEAEVEKLTAENASLRKALDKKDGG